MRPLPSRGPLVPCGRCFVDLGARTRACARPAGHLGICSGLALSADCGERHRMSDKELCALDAEALLRALGTQSGLMVTSTRALVVWLAKLMRGQRRPSCVP